jgi:hypothetical protein
MVRAAIQQPLTIVRKSHDVVIGDTKRRFQGHLRNILVM